MNTMVALAPRLLSIFFLVLIIYYAFAIVGLEFFAGRVHQGCCNTSWYGVKLYYSESIQPLGFLNNTDTPYVYYLNSFDNILRSYGEALGGGGGMVEHILPWKWQPTTHILSML